MSSFENKQNFSPSPEPEDHIHEKKQKKLKLQGRWRFYSESFTTKENWEQGNTENTLKDLGEFKYIQDFWSLYNSMPQLATLKKKESFHLMKVVNKEPIKPIWEDKHNENGKHNLKNLQIKEENGHSELEKPKQKLVGKIFFWQLLEVEHFFIFDNLKNNLLINLLMET
jgi:hypothetical protein